MIATMRTKAQAHKVAELTHCCVLVMDGNPTNKVILPGNFGQYREVVESVSVLFQLSDDGGEKVSSPWTVAGVQFEIQEPLQNTYTFFCTSCVFRSPAALECSALSTGTERAQVDD
jgi:hypothetical protein